MSILPKKFSNRLFRRGRFCLLKNQNGTSIRRNSELLKGRKGKNFDLSKIQNVPRIRSFEGRSFLDVRAPTKKGFSDLKEENL
ncbi:hypothetical protein CH380_12925 [Leptospira adleri]|uniref:Uncharacterized protein n=1 Tax=Leptospira adleri TaxID=2023186 RepID=A0A2M9YN44_9LEPT|nr:hypothetical protein CH380_12925 [Leptospira adleri]PJZ61348.1 hypothetical protein CH376_13675 [Leptospira adleri]